MVMSDACGSDRHQQQLQLRVRRRGGRCRSRTPTPRTAAAGSKKPSDFGDPRRTCPRRRHRAPTARAMSAFDGLPGGDFRLFVNDDSAPAHRLHRRMEPDDDHSPSRHDRLRSDRRPRGRGSDREAHRQPHRFGEPWRGDGGRRREDGETDSRDFGHAVPTKLISPSARPRRRLRSRSTRTSRARTPRPSRSRWRTPPVMRRSRTLTSIAKVTIAGSAVGGSAIDNRFTVGQAVRKRNGSAVIPVTIPGPGKLTSDDAGSKHAAEDHRRLRREGGHHDAQGQAGEAHKAQAQARQEGEAHRQDHLHAVGGSANGTDAPVVLKKRAK